MRMPFGKAVKMILVSTLLVSGSAAAVVGYLRYVSSQKAHDDKYTIVAIVQTCSEKEALKTVYLAEVLDLSIDKPVNLYRFNGKMATQRLMQSPLIKSAEVRKIPPGTIYVDYVSRVPIAFLADYANTAIDAEGVPIPFKPFFTPKKLPEIYLGLDGGERDGLWGNVLEDQRMELALEVLHYLAISYPEEIVKVQRIDVSQSNASSYGQRQVVIVFGEDAERQIVRLIGDNYVEALANYHELRHYLLKSEEAPKIIDLRIPQLAFYVKEGEG